MKNSLWVFVMTALLVSGCSEDTKQLARQTWDTKEEAIQQYINAEKVDGSIVQLNLSDGQVFLLVEEKNGIYFYSEVVSTGVDKGAREHTDQQYEVIKVSPSVSIDNSAGASWEYKTQDDHEYTISMMKSDTGQKAVYVEELDLFVTVREGMVATDQVRSVSNMLLSATVVKYAQ